MAAPGYGAYNETNNGRPHSIGITGYNSTAPMSFGTQANPWQEYFGAPQGELKLNPYDAFARENLALPDAYKGSSPYMTSIIINMVSDADMWPAKIALPYRFTESEMEIVWDELVFNNHLLGPVPEEGVSRLITQQSSERRDHYTRYGLAFLLEHGFMRTPKGRTCYQMNLVQIRNAILETVYIGVIEAYLRSKMHGQSWNKQYGMQARSGPMLRGQLAQEVDDFMAVQKNEHGFDLLDSRAKRFMRSAGVQPDLWVLPEGVKIYLATARPENNQYLLLGPGAGEAYNSALNGKNGDFLDKRNDCSIVESKTFEVPGVDQPVDPLSREVTVGEYTTMFDTVSSVLAPGEYRSAMRDIIIYDEAKDGFVKVGLRTALAHCCRFNERGLLHWPTDDWANDPDHRDDMFIHKLKDGTYRPCTLFGDMSPEALTVEGLRAMGESFKAKVSVDWNATQMSTFRAGLDLLKQWGSKSIDPKSSYARALVTAYTSGSSWSADYDMPNWPGSRGDEPLGYLTYGGLVLYSISAQADKTIEIKAFLSLVDQLFKRVQEMFPRSRAVDASSASSWLYNAEAKHTFFENCIFNAGAPVWIYNNIGTAPAVGSINVGISGLQDDVSQADFDGVVGQLDFSAERKDIIKAAFAVLKNTAVQTAEENLAAFKEIVLGALSSPLQELNSGNSETASKLVHAINNVVGELPDTIEFKELIQMARNLYAYRVAIKSIPTDDERHFNAMYAVHRLLSKVNGTSLQTVYTDFFKVSKAFKTATTPVGKQTALNAAEALFVPTAPAGQQAKTIVEHVDDYYGTVVSGVTVNAATGTGARLTGPRVTVTTGARAGTYVRTRLTSLVDLPADFGIVAVHPAKPEFTAPVQHGANALNGTHPGGPAAMFGAFPPHHGGGGGGRGGGHGGGFGHHAQHEGRHPPPFASKHHEHYHDEDEHGGDERPAQRQRGGFFGAPAYIRQDGTHVDSWDDVAPRPTNAGPHYGYEGAPQQGRYASAYGRRVGPIDEYGRPLTDSQEQERLARRHREMAAEHSLDGDMSDNFAERYDYVLADSDPITRAAKLAFLASPIYRGLLENLLEKDIVFPFGFLLYRPFITHNMATAILTKKGAETGETLIGHADFQLGDDVARKMHYGHYTMYLKSIVYRQDNVFLAQNIYCQNYVSGNDSTFMGWHNLVNDNAPKGSIYSILQPYGAPETPLGEPFVPCSELPNPLDISGRHCTSAPHLVQLDDSNGSNGRVHYANCSYYRHLWRWHNNAADVPDPQGWVYGKVNQYNTLVFQGHQGMYNPATKNYDNIQINTGHFGPRVYPGCGLVRRGMQKTLENISYSSPHGIQRNLQGIGY